MGIVAQNQQLAIITEYRIEVSLLSLHLYKLICLENSYKNELKKFR